MAFFCTYAIIERYRRRKQLTISLWAGVYLSLAEAFPNDQQLSVRFSVRDAFALHVAAQFQKWQVRQAKTGRGFGYFRLRNCPSILQKAVVRRHHIYPSSLQKAFHTAVEQAEITKSSHRSYTAAQFCHPSGGRRVRYTDDSGALRTQQPADNNDLYSCGENRGTPEHGRATNEVSDQPRSPAPPRRERARSTTGGPGSAARGVEAEAQRPKFLPRRLTILCKPAINWVLILPL